MRFVSYNVLSSELSTEEEFPGVATEHLYPPTRLVKLLDKLRPETQRGAVICLQEVTVHWHNALDAWFDEHDYKFTTVIYSPCLGVSIAYPKSFNVDAAVDHVQYHPNFSAQMLFVTIHDVTIANVHIPCMYEDQRLMTDLCHKAYQAATVRNADVICGDFNSRPSSDAYRFLHRKWYSALFEAHGHEPPLTCRAAHAPTEDFALDYIWLAQKPDRVSADGPEIISGLLPNADEPSDHLMIAADVTF
jgi:endonuclease/exonuclease/phosphatase family metal-dependent hydrolase